MLNRNAVIESFLVPLVYSSSYNISFLGVEKLHPFDSSKWGRICQFLIAEGLLEKMHIVEPLEANKFDLLVVPFMSNGLSLDEDTSYVLVKLMMISCYAGNWRMSHACYECILCNTNLLCCWWQVHVESYLDSLKSSLNVAKIIEVPPVALLPNFLVDKRVLSPFRKQVGGTILSAKLAKERGWAINVGGGFHHCSATKGGGFCAYADISLCIHFAFIRLNISRVMIVDLDAHQGNGHGKDFSDDRRVYILDMYNPDIYPFDYEARRYINQKVEVMTGTATDEYLSKLDQALKVSTGLFDPELIIYNAGTDILDGDPLGGLKISPDGISTRDEKVFRFARERNIPIVMLTSGGYMKSSAKVIADSIINLSKKSLINMEGKKNITIT